MKNCLLAALFVVLCLPVIAEDALAEDEVPAHPQVLLETTEGNILLELDGRRAPITVKNFLALVEKGYYDGTVFHRVIRDFMIQAGGYDRDLKQKEPDGGIPNESGNGLPNMRGTVAMARQDKPHTAMAQFFINVGNNRSLDPSANSWGYAVFGYVIEGMDIVDQIAAMPTAQKGPFDQDVPIATIMIEKATRQ